MALMKKNGETKQEEVAEPSARNQRRAQAQVDPEPTSVAQTSAPVEAELVEDQVKEPASVNAKEEPAQVAEKKAATAPAVRKEAPPPSAVVPGLAANFSSPFDSLEGNIPPGTLEFGSIPRITATNGSAKESEFGNLGSWIDLQPMSFNDLFILTPNSDDDEAKEFVKFSYDQEITTDGRSLPDCLQNAIDAGYTDAGIKKYIEFFGILLGGEKLDPDHELIGKLVQLSMAPQSAKLWNGFKTQAAIQVRMNRLDVRELEKLRATVKPKSFGKNDFSVFDFSVAP